MLEEILYTEKYRPKTIDECVLPEHIKNTFRDMIKNDSVTNLLLCGSAGLGKTTAARAIINELGGECLFINASMDGNIDTLRGKIQQFASSVSLMGSGRKFVILDEADYSNANSVQPALRSFIEEYSKNCGFIFTCNFKNKIIEPLHSRCTVIDFKFTKAELQEMAKNFMKRCFMILDKEGIPYDKKVIAELIKKHLPDWRRVLNELQRYSVSGRIDSGILVDLTESSFNELIGYLKDKNFTSMRKWVAENLDSDVTTLYRKLYDQIHKHCTKDTVPLVVLLLAKYQYQNAFVADPEINLVACLTEIMIDGNFQ